MSTFSLDDIRAAADKKYGSTDITLGDGSVCRLLNPLRMPKAQRDALMALQATAPEEGSEESEDFDQEAFLRNVIRTVAENKDKANTLITEVGDDLGVLAQIFESYNTSQESGEASASAS